MNAGVRLRQARGENRWDCLPQRNSAPAQRFSLLKDFLRAFLTRALPERTAHRQRRSESCDS